MKNNEVCFTLSENAVGYKYCQDRMYDLELLLCARVTLTDKLVKVTDDEEKKVVLNALFTGLPGKKGNPSSHGFYPAPLDLELVWMIDFFELSYVVPLSILCCSVQK